MTVLILRIVAYEHIIKIPFNAEFHEFIVRCCTRFLASDDMTEKIRVANGEIFVFFKPQTRPITEADCREVSEMFVALLNKFAPCKALLLLTGILCQATDGEVDKMIHSSAMQLYIGIPPKVDYTLFGTVSSVPPFQALPKEFREGTLITK